MRTGVYLSNRSVAALTGSLSGGRFAVRHCAWQPLPWGLVLGGAVMDSAKLAPLLADFWAQNKLPLRGIRLVIDGDAVGARIMTPPPLSPALLRRAVGSELAPEGGDALCDFADLPPAADGQRRIYAVTAQRALVEGHVSLFAAMGVRLAGLEVAAASAMRFFAQAAPYRGMDFIYSVAQGPDIVSFLFMGGACVFTDRGQLRETRGTAAAAVEISRALQAMVQYSYAQASDTPLRHAFVHGLEGSESQFFGDMGQAIGLDVLPLTLPDCVAAPGGDWALGDYLFCLGQL